MLSQENEEKKEPDPLKWEEYFFKYTPLDANKKERTRSNGDEIKRTWIRLRNLEYIESKTGELTVHGYYPKNTTEFPDDIYKSFYPELYGNDGRFLQGDKLTEQYDEIRTLKIKFKRDQSFKYFRKYWFGSKFKRNRLEYWRNAFSLLTIPVKVRGAQNNSPRLTTSGLTNVSFNMKFGERTKTKYLPDGRQLATKWWVGISLGPSVENVEGSQRRTTFETPPPNSKELFISPAITVGLAINGIDFVFVPFGVDLATSTTGRDWNFNRKRWWGFGIGIETRALGPILAK